MKKARYEILADENSYYGEIEGFEGVWANASNLETCREELEEVLEEWILFRVSQNLHLPIVDGLEDYANILMIPRFKEQKEIFEKDENVTFIKPPVDTLSLMKKCDLVIGAGGSMNREAAILGTPVISCYPGKLLSVDRYYIENGLMKRSTDVDEIVNMALKLLMDNKMEKNIKTDDLFEIIIDNIYQTADH